MVALACLLLIFGAWGCEQAGTQHDDECPQGSYLSVEGNCVREPDHSDVVPDGATARCNDGSYSFSQNRQGTCSQQGGVDVWDP